VECVTESSTQASQGTTYGTDIAVSCCTNGGSGVRGFGANNECLQAKTFGEAEAICTQHGYRLCTLAEMLGRKTKGAGCSHDARYNWVADECSAGSGHQVAKGMRTNHKCGWGNSADSYCQSDDVNLAAYWENSGWHDLDIGVGCCYEDDDGTVRGWRPTQNCNGEGLDNVEPATYGEAVSLCASNNMRLCTVDELLYGGDGDGITADEGCWYNCAYQWASDSCVDINSAATPMSQEHESSTGAQPAESGSASSFTVFTAVIAAVAVVAVLTMFMVMRRWKMRTESRKEQKTESLSEMSVTPTAHVVADTEEVTEGTVPVIVVKETVSNDGADMQ